MSPLIKHENGWKVDKPALITWFITLLVGAMVTVPSVYFGMKYKEIDHDKRITVVEDTQKLQDKRMIMVETYVATDAVRHENICQQLVDIKSLLAEVRQEQKRRERKEIR